MYIHTPNKLDTFLQTTLTDFGKEEEAQEQQEEKIKMATQFAKEVLPPVFDQDSEPPTVFDGTTRLYISYICPYAQRVWITRNVKGLQDKIKLVTMDLQNKPAWYKEKVYPENKVPALEHNNEIKGESIELIKYVNSNFEGPSLLPEDPLKREFAEELFAYTDASTKTIFTALAKKGDDIILKEVGAEFDQLEKYLSKFDDGPFFLGQFSLVDITYIPFVERNNIYLSNVKKYDIKEGRPKLAAWIEEMNKIDAYTQTQADHEAILAVYKKWFPGN